MEDIVLSHHVSAVVAEKGKVQVVLLGESPVGEGVVDADSDDLGVDLVQFFHTIPESAHFLRASACECSWKEC